MKKSILYIITLACSLTWSCDNNEFLSLKDPDNLTSDNYWRNQEDAEAGLVTAYAILSGYGFWEKTEVEAVINSFRDDVIIAGPDSRNYPDWMQISNFSYSDGNTRLNEYWKNQYKGIFRANQVIEKVGAMTKEQISESAKNRIVGEATFLRGLYHLRLLNNWERIVYRSSTPKGEDDIDQALTERNKAWELLEADFREASELLPAKFEGEEIGRATKGAALAFLGRAKLYQKKYAEAATELKKVIDLGQYSLVSNMLSLFDASNENSSESLFEIQVSASKSNNNWIGHVYGKFTSPSELGGWGNIEANPKLIEMMKKEGVVSTEGKYDERLYQTIFFDDKDVDVFGSSFTDVFTGDRAKTAILRKYMHSNHSEGDNGEWQTSFNIMEMRYADVLLMYAEAVNQVGGDDPVKYINMVRNRAKMPNFNGSGKVAIQNQIEHERLMEFTYEGTRFFDLRRWGKIDSAIKASGKGVSAGFSVAKHSFFPIPSLEKTTNSLIN